MILMFLLLIKAAISSHEPRGLVCKLCMTLQQGFLEKGYQHRSQIESFLVKACAIYEESAFCKYFVNGLGNILVEHRIKYFLDNNMFCSHYLDVCDKTTVEYDFDQYRRSLYENYPPIKKSNEKLKVFEDFNVLVLNDIHIQTDYEAKAMKYCKDPGGCCSKHAGRAWRKKDQAGYWGSSGTSCDLPARTFDATVSFIKNNLVKPTFIAVLGDNFGHNYFRTNPNQITDVNTYVYSALRTNFTDSHILPVLGNHECDPVDAVNITDPNDYVYSHIFPSYKSSINDAQIDDLKSKGFYSAVFKEHGVKFISINSQMYDAFNGYMARNSTDPLQFFENFVEELYASECEGQKVIILSHIPIVDTYSIREFGINLKSIFGRFKDTISAHFSGHTHNDSLIFVHDEEGEVVSVNYVSPSLTTFASYSPSFRIYEFDNTRIADYIQYNTDLDYYNEQADKGVFELGFSIAYTLRNEYELKSWGNAEDFAKLKGKILSNSIFTDKYIKNYATSVKAVEPQTTRSYALCLTLDSFDELSKCISTELPNSWNWKANEFFRGLFVGRWFVMKGDSQ